MLHSENPDLINECVDNEGHKALHLCIRNKNNALLKYLLQHGVNINAKGGKLQNTALHEAIGVKDMNAVRYLFSFGIDDSIQNANGHRAIELCPRYLKREFMKAYLSTESIFEHNSKAPINVYESILIYENKNKQRTYLNCMQHREGNVVLVACQIFVLVDICIGCMSLRSTPSHTIRQYVNDYDGYDDDDDEDDSGGGYGHSGNIMQRTKPVTTFGDRVGVNVDEIAMQSSARRLSFIQQNSRSKNDLQQLLADTYHDDGIEEVEEEDEESETSSASSPELITAAPHERVDKANLLRPQTTRPWEENELTNAYEEMQIALDHLSNGADNTSPMSPSNMLRHESSEKWTVEHIDVQKKEMVQQLAHLIHHSPASVDDILKSNTSASTTSIDGHMQ